MKSERRHELKTNELAKGLERLPELARKYGSKILLAVVVIALVAVLIRHRISSQRHALEVAQQNLATAYFLLNDLRNPDLMQYQSIEELALGRKQNVQNARTAIGFVLAGTQDKSLLASALVARGDLNWLAATLPEIPAATTQPSLQLDVAPNEAINEARASYQEVLHSYSDQPMSVFAARFGLAAIAENQKEWGTARQFYEAVQQDERAPVALKTLASMRLTLLESLQKPIYLATAQEPPADTAATQQVQLPADDVAPGVMAPQAPPSTEPASTQPVAAP